MPNYATERDFKTSLRAVFSAPPTLAPVPRPHRATTDGVDWRSRLIDGKVLRAPGAVRPAPAYAPELAPDTARFYSAAIDIVRAEGVPAAEVIAVSPATDPRVREQLAKLLAMPAKDRDLAVGKHTRKSRRSN